MRIEKTVQDCIAAIESVRTVAVGEPLAEALSFPLRVTSWNAFKYQRDGASAMPAELARDADIVLLQESLESAVSHQLSYRYFSPGYRSGDQLSGVETRANQPAELLCSLQFREPWLGTPKAVTVNRFATSAGPLLTINIHAVVFSPGSRRYREQLSALGALLAAHRGPVLLGGDLNHWNRWRARDLRDFAERYQLEEALMSPDWRSRHLGAPVDAFYLRGLRVVSAGAIPTLLSDHHPITVVVEPRLPPQLTTAGAAAPGAAPASAL